MNSNKQLLRDLRSAKDKKEARNKEMIIIDKLELADALAHHMVLIMQAYQIKDDLTQDLLNKYDSLL